MGLTSNLQQPIRHKQSNKINKKKKTLESSQDYKNKQLSTMHHNIARFTCLKLNCIIMHLCYTNILNTLAGSVKEKFRTLTPSLKKKVKTFKHIHSQAPMVKK